MGPFNRRPRSLLPPLLRDPGARVETCGRPLVGPEKPLECCSEPCPGGWVRRLLGARSPPSPPPASLPARPSPCFRARPGPAGARMVNRKGLPVGSAAGGSPTQAAPQTGRRPPAHTLYREVRPGNCVGVEGGAPWLRLSQHPMPLRVRVVPGAACCIDRCARGLEGRLAGECARARALLRRCSDRRAGLAVDGVVAVGAAQLAQHLCPVAAGHALAHGLSADVKRAAGRGARGLAWVTVRAWLRAVDATRPPPFAVPPAPPSVAHRFLAAARPRQPTASAATSARGMLRVLRFSRESSTPSASCRLPPSSSTRPGGGGGVV